MRERARASRHDSTLGGAGKRHWRSARLVLALGALSCMLTACSTRNSEREVLPWFKERSSYFRFGSFAETPGDRTYLVRHFGFLWLPVDATSAVALSDDAVLLDRGVKGKSVLTRNAFSAKPVCTLYGKLSVPPSTSTVDCLQPDLEGNGPGYRRMNIKRTSFAGEPVYEKTVEASDDSHLFGKNQLSFYDGAGLAYFLEVSIASLKSRHAPPDCMLLRGFGTDTRIAARRPDITDVMQCYRPETWAEQIGPTVAYWDTIKYPGSGRDPRR